MSNRRLRLTIRAQRDLLGILQYTYDTWGESKQIEYTAALEQSLTRLLIFPDVGRVRGDIRKDLRSLAVERHLVFYRVTEGEVLVERIVHAHMNVTSKEFD